MTHKTGMESPAGASQQHVDAAVHKIEAGLKHGHGNDGVYKEVENLRHYDTHHNKLDTQTFRHQVDQVNKKLHQDGYLPKLHLVLDDQMRANLKADPEPPPAPHASEHKPVPQKEAHQQTPAARHEHIAAKHHDERTVGHHTQEARFSAPRQSAPRQWSEGPPEHFQTRESDRENPIQVRAVGNVADRQMPISGAPTITAQKIDQILGQYHSPAAGMGQYIFDEGLKYGINPAIALAFYVVESQAGTQGLAAKNNSWGNVRGHGPLGYRSFASIQDSLDHWYQMMKNKYLGQFHADTLAEVIPHYAPNDDGNNEAAYIKSVGQLVRRWSA